MTRSELLPQEILERIPPLYSNEAAADVIIHVKFFIGAFTWLVTECEVQETDVLFYGYVINHSEPLFSEWGYFSLNELMEVRLFGFLEVERDLCLKPVLSVHIFQKIKLCYKQKGFTLRVAELSM